MIQTTVYRSDGTVPYEDEDLETARDADGTTWVRVSDGTPDEMRRVAETFGIHSLSVEDVTRDVRPKTEEYPDHTFVLAKSATLRGGETTFSEELRTRQVGLFFADEWLVTMSTTTLPAVDRVWSAVAAENSRLLGLGPDFAAYRILDGVVDDYFDLLEEVEEDIERIEDGILAGPDPSVLEDLTAVRRDLLSFRKVVWASREAVSVLARGDPEYVHENTEKYYRDVYDHVVHLVDLTETYRDLARGARDIYLNTLSQSTNEVMKTLTVVATILLPLTFVVGVYGMNFSDSPFNMPELTWTYGYPAVFLGMAVVSAVLLLYFQREGWL